MKKTLDKIEKMWYTVHYIVYDLERGLRGKAVVVHRLYSYIKGCCILCYIELYRVRSTTGLYRRQHSGQRISPTTG